MGIIKELYAKDIETRKEPLNLSFGEIEMRVPGFVELKEWDESTAERRSKLLESNMDLYAAIVIKQWAKDTTIAAATEEDICQDIKDTFTGEDVVAVIKWWVKISGLSSLSDFQQKR